MCDVWLRLQQMRQQLHFSRSHGLEIVLPINIASISTVVPPQVYDVREDVAVQDGLQALRIRQRIDVETGGGRHEVKVGGCRRQRHGGAGSCLREVGGGKSSTGQSTADAARVDFILESNGVVTDEEPAPAPPLQPHLSSTVGRVQCVGQ